MPKNEVLNHICDRGRCLVCDSCFSTIGSEVHVSDDEGKRFCLSCMRSVRMSDHVKNNDAQDVECVYHQPI